jgi:rhodanese-related sulfurtransferase
MAPRLSSGFLNIAEVTADDLKAHMETGSSLMVINVLDKQSYDDCRIKGSINVPLAHLKDQAAQWNKNQRMVLYAAHYKSSTAREAFQILDELGFTNIATYEGGMREWLAKRFPSEGACQMDYLAR